MDPNTITLAQLGVFFLEVCAGIAAVGTAVTWILKALGFLRAPERKQDGIHPNDTGYAIMFEIAKKLFQI